MLLNPNCSEIILRLNKYSREQILKELEKIGIIEIKLSEREFYRDIAYEKHSKIKILADKDNPNLPDFTNQATLEITEDEFDNLVIEAFQHTEKQLYPSMLKIIQHFRKTLPDFTEEWVGSGGGWSEIYNEWVEQGKPKIEDYQDIKSKQARKKYCNF